MLKLEPLFLHAFHANSVSQAEIMAHRPAPPLDDIRPTAALATVL